MVLKLRGQSTSAWTTQINAVVHRPLSQKALIGALVFSAIATGLPSAVHADSLETKLKSAEAKLKSQPELSMLSQVSESSSTAEKAQMFEDGVYLYGQSDQPDEIGSAYIVFEARDNQIIGAFYMPYSSFDCVYGGVSSEQLAVTVVDSYSQETYPYAIALEQSSTVASNGGDVDSEISIEGFQRIQELGDMDQQVLATCVSNHQDRVW